MVGRASRPWEEEGSGGVKDQRSRIRWTNPAHRELVLKAAAEHGQKDSVFMETLVLAWFDPFHFSRMIRWLYPNGHPAFEAPGRNGASPEVELEMEDLRADLEAARRERDEAQGRAAALAAELEKSQKAEREAIARLAALAAAQGRVAASLDGQDDDGQVVTEYPRIVTIAERLLTERKGSRSGRGFETEITEQALLEAAQKEGLDKAQTYAQLRVAESIGLLRRVGSRYYVQKEARA
ncbi:MAG: hypothetical protein QOE90_1480 [Thermoplasmata archaeon]|jgi:hypothetical protein|nr:hypothetical protein [Thermoplasmata archaeon]